MVLENTTMNHLKNWQMASGWVRLENVLGLWSQYHWCVLLQKHFWIIFAYFCQVQIDLCTVLKHSAVHKQGAGVQPLQEGGFRGSPLESTLTQLSFRSESSSCSRVQIAIIMATIVFFFCIFTSFFWVKWMCFWKKGKWRLSLHTPKIRWADLVPQ